MSVIIREFVPNDLKRVCEIEKMSFDESYELNMFKQLYDIGAGFLVAEDDGYVVGYVLFWIKYENEGHIISLAVDKDYQRKQAGTKLLLKAINVLSLFKINKILLEVNENNEGAIEFYKKFNFMEEIMSQTTKRVFTHKSKLFLILASMILALSCKNPLGDESGGSGGAGGGGSSGGQTITNEQGKVFPAWYLTEQQQQQNFSIGPTIVFQSRKNPKKQYRIPAIIVADNGNIIAIADDRYTHGGDIGLAGGLIDIVYKVSKDGVM